MGCHVSKLDDDEEIPAGLRPFHGRIEEMKRRRRVRNVSIVSTTELLKPEEAVNGQCVKKVIIKKEEVLEEEFPRSPSFRVYFLEAASMRDSDDDSIKTIQKIKEAKLAQEKETIQVLECKVAVKAHGRENSYDCLISNEDSVNKPNKKEKWRKFKNAQSHVPSFLTVKNRYGPNYTSNTKSEQNLDHPTLKST